MGADETDDGAEDLPAMTGRRDDVSDFRRARQALDHATCRGIEIRLGKARGVDEFGIVHVDRIEVPLGDHQHLVGEGWRNLGSDACGHLLELGLARLRRPLDHYRDTAAVAERHPEVEEMGAARAIDVDPFERDLVLETDHVATGEQHERGLELGVALHIHDLPLILTVDEGSGEVLLGTEAHLAAGVGTRQANAAIGSFVHVEVLRSSCALQVSAWSMRLVSAVLGGGVAASR